MSDLGAMITGIKWNEHGLVPAIIQSVNDGRVLMMAWMNAKSLEMTLESGETVFFSRSRQELWHKGASSGNTQQVESIEIDCDSDSLLIKVREAGPACHTGSRSCFDTGTLELPA
jgi:phosphoribosyl-AMP cyclohydrolase